LKNNELEGAVFEAKKRQKSPQKEKEIKKKDKKEKEIEKKEPILLKRIEAPTIFELWRVGKKNKAPPEEKV
jgi:hypothetical protein